MAPGRKGNTGVGAKLGDPQRGNGRSTRRASGDHPQFPGIQGNPRKSFCGRVWEETGFPKGLLSTIQSIPVKGNPIIDSANRSPTRPCFSKPWQNIAQAESGARFGILCPFGDLINCPPGPNSKKMRAENHVEPASIIPNGAIWFKLHCMAETFFDLWSSKPSSTRGQGGHMGHRGNKGRV